MTPTADRLSEAIDREAKRTRVRFALVTAGFAASVALAGYVAQFDVVRLVEGVPKTVDFLSRLVPPIRADHVVEDVRSWYWGAGKWLGLLLSTLMMALLATTLGTLAGGGLSFLAARNLTPGPVIYWIMRRAFEIARAVPDLVWALVFVFAFGLGPLAGVLAITVHTFGAQGKLYAEADENVDMKPVEGIKAAGGTWGEQIAYGVLPQVLPNFVSYFFWRFEVNVRLATIIGFVGAGGIGMELYETLSLNLFDDAGAILVIVMLTIILIDMLSERLRLRLGGVEPVGA